MANLGTILAHRDRIAFVPRCLNEKPSALRFIYAVVEQPSGTTQQLAAAKSRLAKRNLSVPRLELVAAHMATNFLQNVGVQEIKSTMKSKRLNDFTLPKILIFIKEICKDRGN